MTGYGFRLIIFILIENHVITSVQMKVKSFRPDTSGLLQLSAVPCRPVLPVWGVI